MAVLTCNDVAVLSGSIRMPGIGMWSANLLIDSETVITGPVTLSNSDGSFTLKGTILPGRSGILVNGLSAQIFAGAGGLTQEIPPKFYQGVTAHIVVQEILADCGETLSSTSDAGVLGTSLTTWTRTRGAASRALYNILDSLSAAWRCLPDGTVWVGTPSFPVVDSANVVLNSEVFSDARATVQTESIFLLPARTITFPPLGPQKISCLVHNVNANGCSSDLYFEP